jgi:VanZ family protein
MKNSYRYLLVFLWIIVLSVLTCTTNLEALFQNSSIQFSFNPYPNYSNFFIFDMTQIHPSWVLVKFGHFIGFGILDLLILNLIGKHKTALSLAILFATSTEIFQLYFNRDGRLYDVIIDSLGAVLVYFAAHTIMNLKKNRKSGRSEPHSATNRVLAAIQNRDIQEGERVKVNISKYGNGAALHLSSKAVRPKRQNRHLHAKHYE